MKYTFIPKNLLKVFRYVVKGYTSIFHIDSKPGFRALMYRGKTVFWDDTIPKKELWITEERGNKNIILKKIKLN